MIYSSNIFEKLFLDCNIRHVDCINKRNLIILIDNIIQKYFNIQDIPDFNLLKYARINVFINF